MAARRYTTAILIGQPLICRRLERQLDLMEDRPLTIGWIVVEGGSCAIELSNDGPVLGALSDLEAIVTQHAPSVALVSLPAAMNELIMSIRTRLRKLGVADRFMPMLEDQVAGVGPRSLIDIDLATLLNRPARTIDQEAVRSVIQGKRVLITGAGGSIGSELARIVSRFDPKRLILVDRSENALFEIDRQIARRVPHLQRKALLHDVVDAPATLAHFREYVPQVIFHAAAHKHVPMMEDHPAAAVDNNLFGTKSVADAAHTIQAERFVMISTDKAVNPTSIMGATKRLAELYVQHINRRSQTGFSMVRFGNVLGSSGSVLETWSRQIADGGPVTVTDPRMTRYFMTIPEAAALVIQSAALVEPGGDCGEVLVLDMGEPVRIVELAKRCVEQHGLEAIVAEEPDQPRHPTKRPGQIAVVFTGIRPGEKLFEELAFDAESMRPTRHPDINIWELPPPDERFIDQVTSQLSPARRTKDATALASQIRGFIPHSAAQLAA